MELCSPAGLRMQESGITLHRREQCSQGGTPSIPTTTSSAAMGRCARRSRWRQPDMQRQLVAACSAVPTPGPGLCSEWVALVFNRIGQGQLLPNNDYDADDMFYAYCGLDNLSELRVGMIIAVPSHTHTYAGSSWGHICIYVGTTPLWTTSPHSHDAARRMAQLLHYDLFSEMGLVQRRSS